MSSWCLYLIILFIFLRIAKKVDLKCSHHKTEMEIMWGDAGVSKAMVVTIQ